MKKNCLKRQSCFIIQSKVESSCLGHVIIVTIETRFVTPVDADAYKDWKESNKQVDEKEEQVEVEAGEKKGVLEGTMYSSSLRDEAD
jgi:hypothetical protein